MNENKEIEEIEEIEEEDLLDRTLFQEPVFDDEDDDDNYYLKSIKLIEDTNIVKNMFLENKRFKYDEEHCSNNKNNDNINNLGIKQLSNKRNYFLNGDIKIRKKFIRNIKKVHIR
jgi:ATP sulfurylase